MNESEEPKLRRNRPKEDQMKEKRVWNKWKISFFTLLLALVMSVLVVTIKITSMEDRTSHPEIAFNAEKGSKALSINSTKKQMNGLINYYLEGYLKDSGVDYQFELKNQAVLSGQVKVFSVPVEYSLYFDPYVMENGNIQLKAKSISIGSLGVPIKEVLKIVRSSYKWPDYVEVDPSEKMIIIRLDQLKLKNGMSVKANKIDLVDDVIEASLYLPTSTKK